MDVGDSGAGSSVVTVGSATLHEAAGKVGALPAAISPIGPGMRISGPALPVLSPPGDNLWLHWALDAAQPGDVIVVAFGEGPDPDEFGHWGEVMAVAAQQRRVAGLVIAGGVRDVHRLKELGFATFASSTCIRGTAKDPAGIGAIGNPVHIGDTTIGHGDLVVADDDGVVVIPKSRAEVALAAAEKREHEEKDIFRRLAAGESTTDIYNLPLRRRQ
jgi:4-hydroxy-4-methyl-2-oxoglutarate aldolase